MILTGDIGGTNSRFALVEMQGSRPVVQDVQIFSSHDTTGLADLIDRFRTTHPDSLDGAAFGVAGPIINGRCEATNLPWKVDASEIARALKLPQVGLLNDLEAAAYGISVLENKDMIVINDGVPNTPGNRAVVSAGTGLGEAGLFWNGSRHIPFATEGGHTDFAARNALEFELLQHLTARFGRVSYERVVSGPGMVNIYHFFREVKGHSETEVVNRRVGSKAIDGRTITEAALAGESPLCEATLNLFLSIYGAETGNVALSMLSRGGVWLGGGIIASIAPRLPDHSAFLDAFKAKGRLSPMVADIPVYAIIDDLIALRGAAAYAWRLASG